MIGSYPLQDALEIGDYSCAKLLKERGAKLKQQNEGDYKILISSVKGAGLTKDLRILDLVLDWGVDPNSRDLRTGYYALTQAVWDNDVRIAKALVERGVDPCLQEPDGNMPLDVARDLKRSSQLVGYLESVTDCKVQEKGSSK